MNWALCLPLLLGCVALSGCSHPSENHSARVKLLQVQAIGATKGAGASSMDVLMAFADCPGESRKLVRGDKAFAECGRALKQGETVSADLVLKYNAEKGGYRTDVVKIGDCPITVDPKDEANFEMIDTCTDLKATGTVVGVKCDRTRNKDLVAKCPYLRR